MPVGFTDVIGLHVQNAQGTPLKQGLIWFQPVSSLTLQPIAFEVNGNQGPTYEAPVFAPVVNGQFEIQLADTYLTRPQYIAYKVWIEDPIQRRLWHLPGYSNFQPHGTSYDIDAWEPDLGALVTVQRGPEGPPGIPGGIAGMVIPQQIPAGAIDGTNVTYTIQGVPAIVFYFANGLYQALGVDYTYQVNSANGTSVITRMRPLLPSAPGEDPTSHYVIGITSGVGSGTAVPAAVAYLPITNNAGNVSLIQIVNGQVKVPRNLSYAGTKPPTTYYFIDQGYGTAWSIMAIDGVEDQLDPEFFSSTIPPNAISEYMFTDQGDGVTVRSMSIRYGQLQIS